jgi:multicomponent Na+:H+ antiporter subunit C
MTWALLLACFATLAAGAYLLQARDLVSSVIGLALLGAGVNLALFASGRLSILVPAIVPEGKEHLPPLIEIAANPLPQALVLTAIVIGFALLCFSLVLIGRLIALQRTQDSQHFTALEPLSHDPAKPPLIDEPHS